VHALKRWRARRNGARANRPQVSPARVEFAGASALGPGSPAMPLLRTTVSAPRSGSAMPEGAAMPTELREVLPETTSPGVDRRRVAEAYRQPFGRDYTRRYGRPVGWILASAAVEKVFFPTVLLVMALLGHWEAFWVTVACESLIGLTALVLVTKGHRVEYFFKGLAVIPVRYILLATELVTLGRFAMDLWITKNRKWRK
jgi:hypothetical protein